MQQRYPYRCRVGSYPMPCMLTSFLVRNGSNRSHAVSFSDIRILIRCLLNGIHVRQLRLFLLNLSDLLSEQLACITHTSCSRRVDLTNFSTTRTTMLTVVNEATTRDCSNGFLEVSDCGSTLCELHVSLSDLLHRKSTKTLTPRNETITLGLSDTRDRLRERRCA